MGAGKEWVKKVRTWMQRTDTKATRAGVLGLGQWLPEAVRGNDAWPEGFGRVNDMPELTDVRAGTSGDIYDQIVARHVAPEHGDPFFGTKFRRVADARMTACEAEALAGKAALQDAGVDAKDVDYVLSWPGVPDFYPAGAPRVAHLVGAHQAFAINTDVACASPIAQLVFANALVASGQAKCILLTQSHLFTRAFPMEHPASPNIGDAATALVVGESTASNILATYGISHGEYWNAVIWRRQAKENPPWYEQGGLMYLGSLERQTARKLIQDTVRLGADTVKAAVSRAGLELPDIDVLACVQPRRWIPSAITEALGAKMAAPQTFEEYAHLGGCGMVINLMEARKNLNRPFVAALYAQGAGFTRASAVIRIAP